MAVLSPSQVYALARDAGLNPAQAVTATAIAMAESGLRTDAMGDTTITTATWGPSVGLWQVRSLKADHGTGRTRDAARLVEPAFNARAMVEISGGGANWRPWSVFTSGAYRAKLGEVSALSGAAEGAGAGGWRALVDALKGGTADVGAAITDKLPNPFDDWQGQALGIALKVTAVAAAGGLIIAGMLRLVTPTAGGAMRALT